MKSSPGSAFVSFKRRIKSLLKQPVYLTYDMVYFSKCLKFSFTEKKKKRLAVLYLYADRQKYPNSSAALYELLSRMVGLQVFVLQIDNFNEHKPPIKIRENILDIGGDNTYWEFSGWRKGLLYLNKIGFKADVILFVNDAFLNRSERGYNLDYYKRRIHTFSLLGLRNAVLGKIDYHKETEIFLGQNVSSWIRSNIFAVPIDVADKLDFPFLSRETIDRILPQTFSGEIFNDTELLNDNLKRFLERWIVSWWGKRGTISQKDWALLRGKLIAILNERLLTSHLRRSGVRLIDIDGR